MLTFCQPLSESEQRHFGKYGKWPGGFVLSQKAKVLELARCGAYSLTILRNECILTPAILRCLLLIEQPIAVLSKQAKLIPIGEVFHILMLPSQLSVMLRVMRPEIYIRRVQASKEVLSCKTQVLKMTKTLQKKRNRILMCHIMVDIK